MYTLTTAPYSANNMRNSTISCLIAECNRRAVDIPLPNTYFFLPFTWSAFLTTDLMTPTATVCLMSRTANLPRGG